MSSLKPIKRQLDKERRGIAKLGTPGPDLAYRISSVERGGLVRTRTCSLGFGTGLLEIAALDDDVLIALVFDCKTKEVISSYVKRGFETVLAETAVSG